MGRLSEVLSTSLWRSTVGVVACLLAAHHTLAGPGTGSPAISGNFHRAGQPHCVSRLAKPSRERADGGYYVGGGRAVGGQGRYTTEGTWGTDYAPWYTRVTLNWSHGRKYQGGGGQYEPDKRTNPLRLKAPR